jgi:hypothetical protein
MAQDRETQLLAKLLTCPHNADRVSNMICALKSVYFYQNKKKSQKKETNLAAMRHLGYEVAHMARSQLVHRREQEERAVGIWITLRG